MSQSDIVIRIIYEGKQDRLYLDTKTFVATFDDMETALYHSDRADIEEFCKSYNIPALIRDASLERLRLFRHKRLRIEHLRAGSLIVEGLVVAVAFWVVKETVGESIKQGWRDSLANQKIAEFFRML